MGLKQSLRTWWQARTGVDDSPLDFNMPAWLVSFVVHLGLLILVAMMTTQIRENEVTLTLTAPLDQDHLDALIPEDFHFDEVPTDDVGSDGLNGVDLAASLAPEFTPESHTTTPPDVPIMNLGSISLQETLSVATGGDFAQNFAIKGTVGAVASGAEGAIDRLTQEILLSLEERPTLVVWLFDQSGSLIRQRATIRDRFDRIYRELGIIESSGNKAFKTLAPPLLSSVIGFGDRLNVMTRKPTSELAELKAAIRSIQRDDTGVENVFQAIGTAAEQFRKLRRVNAKTGAPTRNVMFIVFTDEVGNDQQFLDQTVTLCRQHAMPVYVVGVPAPFGRMQSSVKWVDPDPNYDQTPQWGTVDQGPESLYPERLKLRMSGSDDYGIDSGFGPFALTRLCYETGGIYFAVHPNRDTTRTLRRRETEAFSAYFRNFFRPEIMRRYRPDYVSAAEYQQQAANSAARTALLKAARASWIETMATPPSRFVATNEAALANQLTEAQKNAAKLEPQINRIYQALQLGEKDRPREPVPRWQAGYDLAMGRTMAAKVRTESYNAMLAMAKRGMKFENPKNNTWVLAPSNEVATGSQARNHAKKATEYLSRVAEEHAGTPWAMIATKELETPLAWRWQERFTDLAPQRRSNSNNAPRTPRNDEAMRVAKPKPKRPVPKL